MDGQISSHPFPFTIRAPTKPLQERIMLRYLLCDKLAIYKCPLHKLLQVYISYDPSRIPLTLRIA